jgi:hypothetical protein
MSRLLPLIFPQVLELFHVTHEVFSIPWALLLLLCLVLKSSVKDTIIFPTSSSSTIRLCIILEMYKQKVSLNNVSAYKKLGLCVMWLRECLLAFPVRYSSFADRRKTGSCIPCHVEKRTVSGIHFCLRGLAWCFQATVRGPQIFSQRTKYCSMDLHFC